MDNNDEREQKRLEQQRNEQNNIKNARAAVDIAANSGVPGVSTVGHAAKIADTLTGGKATEVMGKNLTKSVTGNFPTSKKVQGQIQDVSNALAESGATDAIAGAMGAKKALGGNKTSVASPKRANSMVPNNMQGMPKPEEPSLSEAQKKESDLDSDIDKVSEELANEEATNEENKPQVENSKLHGEASKSLAKFLMKNPQILGVALMAIGGFMMIVFVLVILSCFMGSGDSASASSSGSSHFGSTASASVTDSCQQISEPLDTFLKSKGTSLEDYNNYIISEVYKAGLGTRNGVVAAAVSLVGGLCQNYQARLPYTMGGAHPPDFYGAKEIWGSVINNGAGEMRFGYGPYYYEGPDCSGFVNWAIHNGGYKVSDMTADSFGSYGATHSMSSFTGQAGDVLFNNHHVVLIIGVEGDNYLIAEASSGENGTRITREPIKSGNYQIVDMTSFYSDASNKVSDYPENKTSNFQTTPDGSASGKPIIFVGDSRTVMMCETYNLCESNKHVAKVSMGYNWLVSDAINEVNSLLSGSSESYNIIVTLGANDYDYQASNYVSKVNELANGSWSSHNVYFASVGPFEGSSENSGVEKFNSDIKSGLNSKVKYCDIYSKMVNGGYKTTDGTHYDQETSQKMYNYLKECLG